MLVAIIRPLCGAECRLVDVGAGTGAILSRVPQAARIAIEGDLGLARTARSGHRLPFVVADLSGANDHEKPPRLVLTLICRSACRCSRSRRGPPRSGSMGRET